MSPFYLNRGKWYYVGRKCGRRAVEMSTSVVLKDKSARRSLKNATILIHEDTSMKIKEELKVETLDDATIEAYFNQCISLNKHLEHLLVD